MLQPYRILLQNRILLLPLKIYHILKEFCSNLMEFYHILWRFYEFYDFTNFVAIFQNFIASFTFVFQSQQLYSTRVFSTSNWGLTSINKCHVQKLNFARFFLHCSPGQRWRARGRKCWPIWPMFTTGSGTMIHRNK